MKAVWNNQILAETTNDNLILIEGNWYFPPNSIHKQYFNSNNEHTICPWKGEASYYDINVDGQINNSAAWYYPTPKDGSIQKVKKDFTNYIAFWRGVEVTN